MFQDVNRIDPLNARHPLNIGRVLWWLAMPKTFGGSTYFDLVQAWRGKQAFMTAGTSGWRPTNRSNAHGCMRLAEGSAQVTLAAIPAALQLAFPLTLACWMRTIGTPTGFAGIFGIYINNTNTNPFVAAAILMDGSGNVAPAVSNGTFTQKASTLSGSSVPNWTRVGITVTTTAMQIYVNGKPDNSITYTVGNPTYAASAQICIGDFLGTGDARNSNCEVDDCSIWNRALTPAEMKLDLLLSQQGYPGVLNRQPAAMAPVAARLFRRTCFDRAGSRGAA